MHFDITTAIGMLGGVFYLASHYMKDMVPLRVLALASSAALWRASATGSPRRGAVPAMGWALTTSPWRETSNSGLAQANPQLQFEAAWALTNIASGTAVRFEPGQQRTVELVDYAGARVVFGFRGLVQGKL